jgi:putative ABC transport system substrate-binding protein
VRQIAFLMNTNEADGESQRRLAAFRKGLGELGWIEGTNIRIDTRWGGGNPEQVQAYAKELVASAPDVLVTNGTPSTAALKRETSSIPIVFAVITDPVGDGFAASLSRPGGNITGFGAYDSEMGGKWVQLLKEVAPNITRAALLFNPRTAPGGGTGLMRPFYDTAARTLAVELVPMPILELGRLEPSLASFGAQPNSGLIAMPDGFVVVNSAAVIRLANELRLPAIYPFRFFAANGGLMSYGVDSADLNQRAASYVDRILKGANPSELPIQTPTKFELVLNLKTAKAIGLEVPPMLLARADEVIE